MGADITDVSRDFSSSIIHLWTQVTKAPAHKGGCHDCITHFFYCHEEADDRWKQEKVAHSFLFSSLNQCARAVLPFELQCFWPTTWFLFSVTDADRDIDGRPGIFFGYPRRGKVRACCDKWALGAPHQQMQVKALVEVSTTTRLPTFEKD